MKSKLKLLSSLVLVSRFTCFYWRSEFSDLLEAEEKLGSPGYSPSKSAVPQFRFICVRSATSLEVLDSAPLHFESRS
ncbi:hypothetical protein V6N13_017161 [Hibiscus sabdariffa]|uniref:Secreted protein n=1 Tax=Hibiscus sabdariffa TaxID=183260 RepID=A0ABR2CZB4_9ROSI